MHTNRSRESQLRVNLIFGPGATKRVVNLLIKHDDDLGTCRKIDGVCWIPQQDAMNDHGACSQCTEQTSDVSMSGAFCTTIDDTVCYCNDTRIRTPRARWISPQSPAGRNTLPSEVTHWSHVNVHSTSVASDHNRAQSSWPGKRGYRDSKNLRGLPSGCEVCEVADGVQDYQ